MNIGLVRTHYTPYGGAEVFLSRLIEGLVAEGHECHIFASEWKNIDRENITFHPVWVLNGGPSFLKVLSFALGAFFALRRENLDIILSFERTLWQDVYRAGDGCHKEWLQKRKRTVSFFRYLTMVFNPLHRVILFIEKRLFKSIRLKAVIANSIMVKDDVIKHYDLPEDKIHVIYNGVDIKLFNTKDLAVLREEYRKTLGVVDGTSIILFVGSGFERKGLSHVIAAVEKLKTKNIRTNLLVVGKGRTVEYERLAKKLNVDKDIIFLGPKKDVRGYYAASDLFVLPTLYDPFSNATLEAMVCGLPVVTSKFNGASEVVAKEEMGCLVQDPSNPEEIANRIEEVLQIQDDKVYKEKGEGIARKYSMEKIVKEYLKVLSI